MSGVIQALAAAGADTVPDSYTFTDATGTVISTETISNEVTPSGFFATTSWTCSGGTASINNGAYASSGTISPGQNVKLKTTSSATWSGSVSVTFTMGGVSDIWTVTNMAQPVGQQLFTSSGSFTVPAGVFSVSVVCVGAGGGYSDASGGWVDGGDSSFGTMVVAGGGKKSVQSGGTGYGGTYSGSHVSGGGAGGAGASSANYIGAGGAGGYSGAGGNGGMSGGNGSDGAGGGGGGGGSWHTTNSGGGGGVGVLGAFGGNGAGGIGCSSGTYPPTATGGGGGSGGDSGKGPADYFIDPNYTDYFRGGSYGGGAGSQDFKSCGGGALAYGNNVPVTPGSTVAITVGAATMGMWSLNKYIFQSGGGAVRVIWGPNRSFPSTNTGDM